jgi:hypothetical protein
MLGGDGQQLGDDLVGESDGDFRKFTDDAGISHGVKRVEFWKNDLVGYVDILSIYLQ